jgi:hypothetical protein
MLNTFMFKALKQWWSTYGEYEEELAKQGIYIYNCNQGFPTHTHIQTVDKDDRQESNKHTTKETKRKR